MRSYKFIMLSILLILLVTLMPGNGKIAGNYVDKLAHGIIFFCLGTSISNDFLKTKVQIAWLCFGVLLGFATEIIQQFIPGRNMDIYDALADVMGLFLGYFLSHQMKSFSKSIAS